MEASTNALALAEVLLLGTEQLLSSSASSVQKVGPEAGKVILSHIVILDIHALAASNDGASSRIVNTF